MKLPQPVTQCLTQLENAGYACWCVGGCVRDWLLGLTPHDYDLCTAATPAEIKALFAHRQLVLAGEKHGTVGIVTDGGVVEITTFRRESGYQDNRHPDRVDFVTDITQDLARRDFTVNAMAWSPSRGLCDPFGGSLDLQRGILRAVGDPDARFQEDSLRILRGIRFAVRFQLQPEENTLAAMNRQAQRMDNLARERVFDELCKLLPLISAAELAQFAPIIGQVLPELVPTMHFQQHSRHHAYDVFTHSAHVVQAMPAQLTLRWAALLHDIGKPAAFTLDDAGQGHFYGHEEISAEIAGGILLRLKAPTALREQVVQLVKLHMTQIAPQKKSVRRWLSRLGPDTLEALLTLQEGDMGSKGTGKPTDTRQFSAIRRLAAQIQAENACLHIRDLAVNGHDLMALGFSGPKLGQALQCLLEQVMDEKLPNEKQALLAAARKM